MLFGCLSGDNLLFAQDQATTPQKLFSSQEAVQDRRMCIRKDGFCVELWCKVEYICPTSLSASVALRRIRTCHLDVSTLPIYIFYAAIVRTTHPLYPRASAPE